MEHRVHCPYQELHPKTELEEKLAHDPSGSWLVLKTLYEGIIVLAIGYKFNSKNTLCFCAPERAGETVEGAPYHIRWPDEFGNLRTRNVLRLVLYRDILHIHLKLTIITKGDSMNLVWKENGSLKVPGSGSFAHWLL